MKCVEMKFMGETYFVEILSISRTHPFASCAVYKKSELKIVFINFQRKKMIWKGCVSCYADSLEFINPDQAKMVAESALLCCIDYMNSWEKFNNTGEAKGSVFAKAMLDRLEKGKSY